MHIKMFFIELQMPEPLFLKHKTCSFYKSCMQVIVFVNFVLIYSIRAVTITALPLHRGNEMRPRC